MYQSHKWWFPDGETHFPKMLEKSVSKGLPPEYQAVVRQMSMKFCKQRGLALDIGANVGLWSRDLCKEFDTVIAVEPVKQFRECLTSNVPDKNLTVVNCALGNESSWIDMIIEKDNSGHSHVNTQTMGQGQIQMMTLDEYMETIDRPKVDYVKIDCEGYEYQIILGGKQTLIRDRPIMVVEDKKHKDVGHVFYDRAIATLISWGAKELGRVRADVILGWS